LFDEPGFNTYERMWVRPTLEVNGIWGGFQGEGNKTVIPSQAHAKITCRLVPDQNPLKINALLKAHIKKNTPQGVKVNVQLSASSADPYVIAHDHPGNQAARAVHQVVYGKEPYYIRTGGTIPICGIMKKYLGVSTVNFAFGLKDERTHAPDEFFRLSSFERSQKAYCLLLEELASRKF
jgi:acetylornithine deacetylase/succinyl-diaminopimelate desuccinylase-like protein